MYPRLGAIAEEIVKGNWPSPAKRGFQSESAWSWIFFREAGPFKHALFCKILWSLDNGLIHCCRWESGPLAISSFSAFGLVLYGVLSFITYGSPPQDQECLLPRLSWFFAWFGWLSCYCYGCLQDNCNKPLNLFSLGVPAPGYWISGTESARLRPIFAKQERGQEAAKQHSYTRRMGHGGSQPCYSGTTGRFVNNRRKQPLIGLDFRSIALRISNNLPSSAYYSKNLFLASNIVIIDRPLDIN